MKALGICLGASTVTAVLVEQAPQSTPRQIERRIVPHDGNPRKALLETIEALDPGTADRIAVTGRKFRHFVRLSTIAEPEAVEHAYQFVKPSDRDCPAVVSAGGETFMVYVLDRQGRIGNVITGNKCASGTGEFFMQQLRRMNVSLEEAARWAVDEEPYAVSGRCSVFCKSDCTHATNKGVPRSRVTAGLCRMMADKILELLKRTERRDIMVVGGTTQNRMMIAYLRQAIPGLVVPEAATGFEALGAALWALANETAPWPGLERLLHREATSFERLPPLAEAADRVAFRRLRRGPAAPGDRCILGLDVGSTTTKAVLLRTADNMLLADVYLRTNGDPVGASRRCYAALAEQVPADIEIGGLGVCGSGRQIAGLHALTDGVINEIIAHATAAVHFDPAVDTLFEIGGQDAKYTYITNGVPSDYAMNEACSAGTGSFLEESALETLGVAMTDIADIALAGECPPNFNDQCAAFIASDIKNAVHEGMGRENIVAGLVYSICMNYTNRVKGNRPVGDKVFMQGGVCYNRAVPMAMAQLTGKPIVVPPEPGLMGAFGVALAVKQRLGAGLLAEQRFDLAALAAREVGYGRSFTCRGGREKCDRGCTIRLIEIEGRRYPFGGACNRYENLRRRVRHDAGRLDDVRRRQRLVFETFAPSPAAAPRRGRVGLNRSFLVNSYYPLYAEFFTRLGFEPVLPDRPASEGIDRRNAPFCYPVELAHGFFHTLIATNTDLDYVFLPHVKSIPTCADGSPAQICPLAQGESFYLRSAFRERLHPPGRPPIRVLAPRIEMNAGLDQITPALVETARRMGIDRACARRAAAAAISRQRQCEAAIRQMGREALAALEDEPDRPAVVIFGRPYNAFVPEAHMGIPHKLASHGVRVIPMDALPVDTETGKRHMYWGMGQLNLKAARYVARHPRLFGTFITNFSCGPDSFVIGYFRSIMGRKPSLTLELDSHTADAGIDTRIEAFLDIVEAYRQSHPRRPRPPATGFRPAAVVASDGRLQVRRSDGRTVASTDPSVTLLFPSMGRLSTEAMAAVFRGLGFAAVAHPPADEAVLKLGRGHTSCKECLPLILTTGTLLNYLRHHRRADETVVYFMPTGSGPCRFGQYRVFMEDLLRRLELPDVALFSLTSDDAYAGLPRNLASRAWWAVVASDEMENRRNLLLANAVDRKEALAVFESSWRRVLDALENGARKDLERVLAATAGKLGRLPARRPWREVPAVGLTGEIFVRRDGLSRRFLAERLADMGFAAVCAPVAEWVFYTQHVVNHRLDGKVAPGLLQRLRLGLRNRVMRKDERHLKAALNGDGLPPGHMVDIPETLAYAAPYISPYLTGEAALTVGSALMEVVDRVCGVIAIGPFGCMPNRLSEALLSEAMTRDGKLAANGDARHRTILSGIDDLPFLAIESDGSPFPQLIEAKLETFCLRARRLHEAIRRQTDSVS